MTGATGCVGSNVTRALVARGERVAIFRLPNDSLAALGDAAARVEHRVGDVRDFESVARAMAGVSRVYHVAGIAVPLNALHAQMMAVNVRGTENVARAALEAGVGRLVHTSSISAVGFPPRGVVADERFPFNGGRFHHSYVSTKRLGEQVMLEYVRRGLDAVVLNPTPVMAPGGSLRHGWAELVLKIKQGRLPFYPGGGQGVTTGRDVVDAHLKAMERGVRGERYIVNTLNLTFRELWSTVARVVGAPRPRVRVPDAAIRAASQLGSLYATLRGDPLNGPILVKENVFMLTGLHHYDQAKAVRELGISQSSLEEAVQEVYAWCRAQGACL